MAFGYKLLSAFVILLFIAIVKANPVEESKELAARAGDEMMETAESQNPFLPRFAMRKLKEKRERAKAQRRNNQGQRRTNQLSRVRCPQNKNYKK